MKMESMMGRAASVLREQEHRLRRILAESPVIVAGTAHADLARSVGAALGQSLGSCAIERFPDGELKVDVGEEHRGRDVYVVEPTVPPVGENVLELVLIADALHRTGAARVSAVIPYFGFARQERRTRPGEPLGARVAADLVACGRFARLVAIDLHAASVEGFFPMPVEHLSAVPILASAVRAHVRADSILVSPDLGGAKLAREYARILELPVAIVHKTRLTGRRVEVHEVVGDVKGKCCIIVDDLISTGGTIEAAAGALRARGAKDELTVVATHALLAGDALDVLARARVTRLIATDTVPPREGGGFERKTVSVGALLADAIRRLSSDRSAFHVTA